VQSFIRSLSPLASFCLGFIIALLAFYLSFVDNALFVYDRQTQAYGQSIADVTAQRSVEPSFNNNLVSLRGIVQDAALNPQVVAVTIHDVEDKLLVQAGVVPQGQWVSEQSFTAQITLHESIAGYVTVISDAQPLFPRALSAILLSALGAALAGLLWSLYQSGALRLPKLTAGPKISANTHSGDSSIEEPAEEIDDSHHEAPANYAYAAVCVKNIAVLKQQLDGSTFRKIFASFEALIDDIRLLYNGVDWRWQEDRYIALFHAACAAHLALELASILHNIPLDLSAQIDEDDSSLNEAMMPFAGLAVTRSSAEFPELKQRAVYLEISESEHRLIISAFKAPYAALLEKQCQQLSA
jgi:hypothetical protein